MIAVVMALSGCEGLQRKFTRKRKHPAARPDPILAFKDYTKAMTPSEKYRKHSLMFDYWNGRLLEAFHERPISSKRVQRASGEALRELETLHDLLNEETADHMAPLVEERTRLHEQISRRQLSAGVGIAIRRRLEAQTRQFNREFFWRLVEDQFRVGHSADAQGR